jgi:hypothetical protein
MAGWHCVENGVTAACVPEKSVRSDACPPTGSGDRGCLGTTQITCAIGYIVENRKCNQCVEGECRGGLQAKCAADSECLPGFQCLKSASSPYGLGECQAPCTGPALANPACLALEVDTSLPYNSIYGKCTDGFCRY